MSVMEYKCKRKNYTSLSQLKDEMDSAKKTKASKIVSFDGAFILTQTHQYGMYMGEIIIRKL